MKYWKRRRALLPLLAAALGVAAGVLGQPNAATVAAQEDAEDRYRRLTAQLAGLKETQDLHHQQIAVLERTVREWTDQLARAGNNNVTQEKFNALTEQIRKVDEARVAENKKIFDAIDELHRVLKNLAAAPPPRSVPSSPSPAVRSPAGPSPNDEGFDYRVQTGDTLGGIVQAYRQQNIQVTSKASIKDANPNVANWDRLSVGQKLWIPKPRR